MNDTRGKWLVLAATMALCAALAGVWLWSSREEPPVEPVTLAPEAQPADEAETEGQTMTAIEDSLILLPGGSFSMGSPESEPWREADETQHTVTVSAFYVDPYEVRQADYEAVMGENPSYFRGADLPVESVTWYDAVEYCNRLSVQNGLTPAYTVEGDTVLWDRSANGYRLLTEAEWEYAARAGTATRYNVGDQVHSDSVNFEGSYPYNIETNYVSRTDPTVVTSRYRGATLAGDALAPNAFGLYHTHGNVSEWVFDLYGAYDLTETADPAGAASGALRVNRGGSYLDFGRHLRSACRSAANPLDADRTLGFRIGRNAAAGEGSVTTTLSVARSIPENPRILVAYFSRSGNTEEAARIIADKTGGDLFEIAMETPYTGNIYRVSAEDLANGVRPALAAQVEDMAQYDVVLLGYPTWWATLPMPVVTFLESYDWAGKTIVSFSSHGGTRFGDSVSDLSKLTPGAYVGFGYEFQYSGSDADAISEWLARNGVPER